MADNNNNTEAFDLGTFFPYLVRIYYRAVSQSVADIYSRRHGLTVYEWRAMAVLGNNQPLTASEIVNHSSLDKVQVSRAIKSMTQSSLLERRVDNADKRRANLYLTTRGNEVFNELVPLVKERENELLSGLTDEETMLLKSLMSKVRNNAEVCLGGIHLEDDREAS